jgi:hypothetical protein
VRRCIKSNKTQLQICALKSFNRRRKKNGGDKRQRPANFGETIKKYVGRFASLQQRRQIYRVRDAVQERNFHFPFAPRLSTALSCLSTTRCAEEAAEKNGA